MEVPRLVHDTLLHELQEPQERALAADVARVTEGAVEIVVCDDETGSKRFPASENTPLLMAGTHHVKLTKELDLKALALRLDEEERAAVLSDHNASARSILAEESKTLFVLAVPLILASIMEFLPDMVVTMMLGHSDPARSTQILAANSLNGLIQLLLVGTVLTGVSSAVDTLGAQAFGAKRLSELWLFVQAGLIVYMGFWPFVSLVLLNSHRVLVVLGQDPAISAMAGKILFVGFLAFPFMVLFALLKSSLQAQNIVQPLTVVTVISWGFSLPVAYYLGFYTSLSYIGIVVSILVNNVLKSLALIPIVIRSEAFRAGWPGWQFHQALRVAPRVARLGTSSVLMVFFQTSGLGFIQLLSGWLPQAAMVMSANNIFATMLVISFMPLLGVCIAGAIRMGNALGAGQARRASLVGALVMAVAVGVALVCMIGTLAVATPYARSFTTNEEAVALAVRLIWALAFVIPMLGLTFGIQAILRACGKQWLCAKLYFVFNVGVGIPLSLGFALQFDAGLLGLWYGHLLGVASFILAGCWWIRGMSWDLMAHEARLNTHLHVEPAVEPLASSAVTGDE
ncbi:hypothetical protein ATCC90586_011517 [Pythium insidiosum]|nr:hypothetical protein ATCC90586_011517 [Pythium insidiosum]